MDLRVNQTVLYPCFVARKSLSAFLSGGNVTDRMIAAMGRMSQRIVRHSPALQDNFSVIILGVFFLHKSVMETAIVGIAQMSSSVMITHAYRSSLSVLDIVTKMEQTVKDSVYQ